VAGSAIAWAAGTHRAVALGLELSRAFEAPDAEGYARALAADYAARAPRYAAAFVEAARAIAVPPAGSEDRP
jgi:hypothetical protein